MGRTANSFVMVKPVPCSWWSSPRVDVRFQSNGNKRFNYGLTRRLIEEARLQAEQLMPCKTNVIMPYGFELLAELPSSTRQGRWPIWPTRHYPTIGYSPEVSADDAKSFGFVFLSVLVRLAQQHYPLFYEQLKYVEIHNGGFYSQLQPSDYTLEKLKVVNTMHIELFCTHDILQHYANYVITLFGAMVPGNANLPEIRDFYDSKTRRNRLFQLFLICSSIAEAILPDLLPLSVEQKVLYKNIFNQLRIQNPFELIKGAPSYALAVSCIEIRIRDELIFPRIQQIRQFLLQQAGESVQLTSISYYNNVKAPLEATLPSFFVKKGTERVVQTYLKFPGRVAAVTGQLRADSVTSIVSTPEDSSAINNKP